MLKRIGRSKIAQRTVGSLMASYLRLVKRTSRLSCEPEVPYSVAIDHLPMIVTFWHGQHFMLPTTLVEGVDVSALISRHGDGEMNAIAAQKLGFGLVRGAGDTKRKGPHKGGMTAYRRMLTLLKEGHSITMTADVPKISRICGTGVIKLARDSGRPLFPVAFASSRRIELGSWDKASLNLPFSHNGFVVDGPIYVPRDADDETMEAYRLKVEETLNHITARSIALAEHGHG